MIPAPDITPPHSFQRHPRGGRRHGASAFELPFGAPRPASRKRAPEINA